MAKAEESTKAEQHWITETKDRLAQRRGKKPATKAGQLRALWPEIRAAKAEGQKPGDDPPVARRGSGKRCHCPKPRFLHHPHTAEGTSDFDRTALSTGASPSEDACFKHASEDSD